LHAEPQANQSRWHLISTYSSTLLLCSAFETVLIGDAAIAASIRGDLCLSNIGYLAGYADNYTAMSRRTGTAACSWQL
jgi:hypothetical protein